MFVGEEEDDLGRVGGQWRETATWAAEGTLGRQGPCGEEEPSDDAKDRIEKGNVPLGEGEPSDDVAGSESDEEEERAVREYAFCVAKRMLGPRNIL
jgi:hypothetical protein